MNLAFQKLCTFSLRQWGALNVFWASGQWFLHVLSLLFTCKWSMTANDMLPSNLTFDEILTVFLCGSGSGQFRFSEHNFKKRCETIRTAKSAGQAQQVSMCHRVCQMHYDFYSARGRTTCLLKQWQYSVVGRPAEKHWIQHLCNAVCSL